MHLSSVWFIVTVTHIYLFFLLYINYWPSASKILKSQQILLQILQQILKPYNCNFFCMRLSIVTSREVEFRSCGIGCDLLVYINSTAYICYLPYAFERNEFIFDQQQVDHCRCGHLALNLVRTGNLILCL